MSKFYYRFSYKTFLEILDLDDEKSGFIVIFAQNKSDATLWGETVAAWYVNKVNEGNVVPPWSSLDYNSRVVDYPSIELLAIFGAAPAINFGEYPDYLPMALFQRDAMGTNGNCI